MQDRTSRPLSPRSRLVHNGRNHERPSTVNPAVSRGSTYLHASVQALREAEKARATGERMEAYGRRGTQTAFHLEDVLTDLEGGAGTRLTSSGLAANALVFQALLRPGDHAIISDGVYGPVRRYAKTVLSAFDIAFDFCAADCSDVARLFNDRTRLVYVETPASTTFEVVDLPEVARIAHAHGAVLAVDNTWASSLLYRPLAHGADVSVLSATKYLGGHSDVLLGALIASDRAWPVVNEMADATGVSVSPDDASTVLRGLRTLDVRLREQARQAERLIAWFEKQDSVADIFYPPRPAHAGHAIWRRDFTGANGLFSVVLKRGYEGKAEAFVDRLALFGIGASWGGYESLVRIDDSVRQRRVTMPPAGPVIRVSAGLEDIDDLLADLDTAADFAWRRG